MTGSLGETLGTTSARGPHALNQRPMRTVLFCPGDSARKMAKAQESGADMVIFDLEDAVMPGEKDAARQQVCAILRQPRPCPVIVRVNAQDTPWYLADIAAIAAAGPDAIMLPKCTGPHDLAITHHQLDALETANGLPLGGIALIPLVSETAASLQKLHYAGVTSRLAALGFAGEDLASDLGVLARGGAAALNPLLAQARGAVAMAAAAAGVPAIDTPFPDPNDDAGLCREAGDAAVLGYAGKFCIHPRQIGPVATQFTPAPERLVWAQAVAAAFQDNASAGAILLDGKMIDRAHLRLANRFLQSARP